MLTEYSVNGNIVQHHVAPAVVTVLRSESPLCKSFELGPDGGVVRSDAAGQSSIMTRGTAEVVEANTAAQLAEILKQADTHTALCFGRLKSGATTAKIGSSGSLQPGEITRSQQNFEYPVGPGWMLLDFDSKNLSTGAAEQIDALGGGVMGVWAALCHLWPELDGATAVLRESSSAGVYASAMESEADQTLPSVHFYVLLRDVSQTPLILSRLMDQGWALNLTWYVPMSGTRQIRGIVDAAVKTPERLIYVAEPQLGNGVSKRPTQMLAKEGVALGVPEAWEIDTQAQRDSAAEIEPELERQREEIIEKRAQEDAGRTGKPIDQARREAHVAMTHDVLEDDLIVEAPRGLFPSHGSSFQRRTIGEILDAVTRNEDTLRAQSTDGIIKLPMPDPYRGSADGPTKCTLRWERGYPTPALVAHWNGAPKYHFGRFVSQHEREAFEVIATAIEIRKSERAQAAVVACAFPATAHQSLRYLAGGGLGNLPESLLVPYIRDGEVIGGWIVPLDGETPYRWVSHSIGGVIVLPGMDASRRGMVTVIDDIETALRFWCAGKNVAIAGGAIGLSFLHEVFPERTVFEVLVSHTLPSTTEHAATLRELGRVITTTKNVN